MNDLVLPHTIYDAVGVAQLQGDLHQDVVATATFQDVHSDKSSDSEVSTHISEISSDSSREVSSSISSTERCSESQSSQPSSQHQDSDDTDSFIGNVHVYNGSELTVNDGVLLLMDLFLENKLTKKGVGKILTSVHKLLPKSNNMPKSKHELF